MHHAVSYENDDKDEDGADPHDEVAPINLSLFKGVRERLGFPEVEQELVDFLRGEEIESAGFQNLNLDHLCVFWEQEVEKDSEHDDLQRIDHAPEELERTGKDQANDATRCHDCLHGRRE